MDYHALEQMPVMQLREEAKKIPDVKGVTGMKKGELITLLADHLGLEAPEKKAAKRKSVRTPLDKSTIKQKILELREQRDKARDKNDGKTVNLLRRRIHSLKRQTRRIA